MNAFQALSDWFFSLQIYLPIAEVSLNVIVLLAIGGGVGLLSGLFGVGGGFLTTPLMIFYGIPPAVAVASSAPQITGASVSGVLAHGSRDGVDYSMGAVLVAGGAIGSLIGGFLFRLLQDIGQIDTVVSVMYVVMLGGIGIIMLRESLATLKAYRSGTTASARVVNHVWIHGLPLKMRFRQSRLYISVIPPIVIGMIVGALSAIMGVGGGFIIVPAMIYLLRMPTNVVIGTSLVQIIVITAVTTILQATSNYSVDIVLATLLVFGGVAGAQIGVRVGAKLSGEQLRLLLALMVLAVALKLFWGLVAAPPDIYSLSLGLP